VLLLDPASHPRRSRHAAVVDRATAGSLLAVYPPPPAFSDKTTMEEDVKDGPSYSPSCLWKGFMKMKSAQKTRYRFCFLFVFF
jgi:hypothetical protein